MAVARRRERYEAEHEKRMTLYRMGMTDAQIAAALQIPVQSVRSWRRREGLHPNPKRRARKRRRPTIPGGPRIRAGRMKSASPAPKRSPPPTPSRRPQPRATRWWPQGRRSTGR